MRWLAAACLRELQVIGLFAVIVLLRLIGLVHYSIIAQLRHRFVLGTFR